MKPISVLVIALALAALSSAQTPDAAPSQGQWDDLRSLPADAVVRVQIAPHSMEGRLASVTDDALVIRIRRRHHTLPRASVLSVSLRGKSHRGRHALIGFAVGAGIGLGAGEVWDAGHPCTPPEWCIVAAPIGKVILGPAGALIGAAIGGSLPEGNWRVIYTK